MKKQTFYEAFDSLDADILNEHFSPGEETKTSARPGAAKRRFITALLAAAFVLAAVFAAVLTAVTDEPAESRIDPASPASSGRSDPRKGTASGSADSVYVIESDYKNVYCLYGGFVKRIGREPYGELGYYVIIEISDPAVGGPGGGPVYYVYSNLSESPDMTNPMLFVGNSVYSGTLLGIAECEGDPYEEHLKTTYGVD